MSGDSIDRRQVLKVLVRRGIGSAVFGRALTRDGRRRAQDHRRDDPAGRAGSAGPPITDEQRKLMLEG